MSAREKAISVVQQLRRNGYEAYLAGGCVRDMLLHKPPQDYDIATSARPEDVQRVFPQTVPVGAQFGVILVLVEGEAFEVASFRYDGPYLDGRRPAEVRYGSLDEDIQRRDFTINGMMFDPVGGRVIDMVGGQQDLDRQTIRAIGDARLRFAED
ncbi:MAG TPA: CCA tRNA nucleotidyltransferase, partial [Candidatus Limnocylindria bacterium]|nr:CCA tRNA nucleotidyltransferase [Candidatus Limnocylindria bacterium]